jgi:serine/threonine protein kinase
MPETSTSKSVATAFHSSPHLGSHNPHHAKYDPMEFVQSIQDSLPPTGNHSSSDYETVSILGQSAYGEVLLAVQKSSSQQKLEQNSGSSFKTYSMGSFFMGNNSSSTSSSSPSSGSHKERTVVLKKINRLKMNKNLVANEVAAASILKHPGIVKVHDVFKEGVYTFLVLEHLKGVDFFKYLSAKNFAPMREKEAKKLFKQLVDGLMYAHSQGFAHRDVKLENIMYDKKKGKAKLIDFGLCERITDKNQLCDLWCGSQDYVCPEIIKKEPYNGFLADVWSLGTILYIMLYGELPFGFDQRVKAINEGKPHPTLQFADDRNPNIVSDSAKDLVAGMLQADPAKRLSMEAVQKHRWLKSKPLEFLSTWSLS